MKQITTRSEAIRSGAATYFTGKPCKHGHVSERRTENSDCIQCTIDRASLWNSTNKERRSEISRKSARKAYWKAPEQKNADAKAWRAANQRKVAAIKRRWKQIYPDKNRAHVSKRRAAKLKATPAWADGRTIADLYAEAAYFGLEIDHIVPLQSRIVCGLHNEFNLAAVGGLANRKKGNRHWPDMP